jgi:hypothetical protein
MFTPLRELLACERPYWGENDASTNEILRICLYEIVEILHT